MAKHQDGGPPNYRESDDTDCCIICALAQRLAGCSYRCTIYIGFPVDNRHICDDYSPMAIDF